jgi:hypothetical protein
MKKPRRHHTQRPHVTEQLGPSSVRPTGETTTDDERLIRERLLEYFSILRDWSLKTHLEPSSRIAGSPPSKKRSSLK